MTKKPSKGVGERKPKKVRRVKCWVAVDIKTWKPAEFVEGWVVSKDHEEIKELVNKCFYTDGSLCYKVLPATLEIEE